MKKDFSVLETRNVLPGGVIFPFPTCPEAFPGRTSSPGDFHLRLARRIPLGSDAPVIKTAEHPHNLLC